MASNLEGFSFKNVRASPTNPHKKPTFIQPHKLQTKGGSSSSAESLMSKKQGHSNPIFALGVSDDKKPEDGFNFTDIRYDEITSSTSESDNQVDDDEKKSEKIIRLTKLVLGIIIILVAIIGTVYFILYYTHPNIAPPESKRQVYTTTTQAPDQFCSRSQDEVGFKEILMINCQLIGNLTRLSIIFKPEYGTYRSAETFEFNITDERASESGWNITVDAGNVVIIKPPAKCDSGGNYTFDFYDANSLKLFTHKEEVTITSKVSDVQLQVQQSNETNIGFYSISCSARSACAPAPITLLGVFSGNRTEPIFGVNFTCIINYNDDDGWTVKCSGTVPASVYSSLNSIACRPTTGNKTVDEETEIKYKFCRECIFECPTDGSKVDSYWYDNKICNIFHRCYYGTLYTQPCPPKTYFNTKSCTCDHTNNLPGECDVENFRVVKLSERDSCAETNSSSNT